MMIARVHVANCKEKKRQKPIRRNSNTLVNQFGFYVVVILKEFSFQLSLTYLSILIGGLEGVYPPYANNATP